MIYFQRLSLKFQPSPRRSSRPGISPATAGLLESSLGRRRRRLRRWVAAAFPVWVAPLPLISRWCSNGRRRHYHLPTRPWWVSDLLFVPSAPLCELLAQAPAMAMATPRGKYRASRHGLSAGVVAARGLVPGRASVGQAWAA